MTIFDQNDTKIDLSFLDAVVVENEHALNKKFKAQVVETKTIEYPAKAIKTTKASPNIEWCMNPQQYSSDEFKGRQDFPELIETIKSLENSKSTPKTILKNQRFSHGFCSKPTKTNCLVFLNTYKTYPNLKKI